MTDKEWLTVSEVSGKLNIPVETIRRYIRSHSVHLKVKKQGKKYLLHNDSMTVIKQIRSLYDRSMNVDEVEENLSASGFPMTITVKNNDDEAMTVRVADELQEIKLALDEQKDFNNKLLDKLNKQNEYINQSLETRDQRLMEAIRENQQARIETVATQQKTDKQGFFARLFGK
jgi:DNA-binding transcriptional MerR regulator